jgi:hypothetical protein
MRDRDYALKKPPATFRFALVGGSNEMGSGVDDDEVLDELVEDRLNQQHSDSVTYEILNFSVTAYHLLQKIRVVDTRIRGFEPDALLYMSPQREEGRLSGKIADMLEKGLAFEYPFLQHLLDSIGIDYNTPREIARERLEPVTPEIVAWGYRMIVDSCRNRGIIPVWVLAPILDNQFGRVSKEDERLMQLAAESGFLVMNLMNAFDGYDVDALYIAPFDRHPNVMAHRLLANELYEEIHRLQSELGLPR